MTDIVFMFPGQSSRYPDMVGKLVKQSAECARIVRAASDLLGRDLAADNTFATNRDVQVGVFLANHLHWQLAEAAGLRATRSLGLSLGEYNHLVHIGAIGFEDALRLVDARGQLYDEAQGGVMISVFPIDGATIEGIITRLGFGDRACVGLYNSPRQQVVSGERAAVETIVTALEDEVYVDSVLIEPRIAMHSPYFAPIGTQLAGALADAPFVTPRATYVPNVLGGLLEPATPDQIREQLIAHTHQPVRWQACVEAVAAFATSPVFVEVGPKSVLYNMIAKQWQPGARAKTDLEGDTSAHVAALAQEFGHAS